MDEDESHQPPAMLVSPGGKAITVSDAQLLKVATGMIVTCVAERSIDVRAACWNAATPMAVSVVGNKIDVKAAAPTNAKDIKKQIKDLEKKLKDGKKKGTLSDDEVWEIEDKLVELKEKLEKA